MLGAIALLYTVLVNGRISIQLDCEADVLALGAETQATSVATQHNNILMDLSGSARLCLAMNNHYRSDPVQVQSTREHD